MAKHRELPLIGWREWVKLPLLEVARIKVKIDTGARSSSLHVFGLETYFRDGREFVRFGIHPFQRSTKTSIQARAEVLEHRKVRSSSGHARKRPVIVTEVELLGARWPIEVTLANRDAMGFRMLLGRQAVRERFCIDAGRSYYGGRPKRVKRKKTKAAQGSPPRKR